MDNEDTTFYVDICNIARVLPNLPPDTIHYELNSLKDHPDRVQMILRKFFASYEPEEHNCMSDDIKKIKRVLPEYPFIHINNDLLAVENKENRIQLVLKKHFDNETKISKRSLALDSIDLNEQSPGKKFKHNDDTTNPLKINSEQVSNSSEKEHSSNETENYTVDSNECLPVKNQSDDEEGKFVKVEYKVKNYTNATIDMPILCESPVHSNMDDLISNIPEKLNNDLCEKTPEIDKNSSTHNKNNKTLLSILSDMFPQHSADLFNNICKDLGVDLSDIPNDHTVHLIVNVLINYVCDNPVPVTAVQENEINDVDKTGVCSVSENEFKNSVISCSENSQQGSTENWVVDEFENLFRDSVEDIVLKIIDAGENMISCGKPSQEGSTQNWFVNDLENFFRETVVDIVSKIGGARDSNDAVDTGLINEEPVQTDNGPPQKALEDISNSFITDHSSVSNEILKYRSPVDGLTIIPPWPPEANQVTDIVASTSHVYKSIPSTSAYSGLFKNNSTCVAPSTSTNNLESLPFAPELSTIDSPVSSSTLSNVSLTNRLKELKNELEKTKHMQNHLMYNAANVLETNRNSDVLNFRSALLNNTFPNPNIHLNMATTTTSKSTKRPRAHTNSIIKPTSFHPKPSIITRSTKTLFPPCQDTVTKDHPKASKNSSSIIKAASFHPQTCATSSAGTCYRNISAGIYSPRNAKTSIFLVKSRKIVANSDPSSSKITSTLSKSLHSNSNPNISSAKNVLGSKISTGTKPKHLVITNQRLQSNFNSVSHLNRNSTNYETRSKPISVPVIIKANIITNTVTNPIHNASLAPKKFCKCKICKEQLTSNNTKTSTIISNKTQNKLSTKIIPKTAVTTSRSNPTNTITTITSTSLKTQNNCRCNNCKKQLTRKLPKYPLRLIANCTNTETNSVSSSSLKTKRTSMKQIDTSIKKQENFVQGMNRELPIIIDQPIPSTSGFKNTIKIKNNNQQDINKNTIKVRTDLYDSYFDGPILESSKSSLKDICENEDNDLILVSIERLPGKPTVDLTTNLETVVNPPVPTIKVETEKKPEVTNKDINPPFNDVKVTEIHPFYFKLMEIFPDICPDYLRKLCSDNTVTRTMDDLVSILLNGDYNRRDKPASPEPNLNFEEQNKILQDLFPDADPTYLQHHCERLIDNPDNFKQFVATLIEYKDYPTKEEYLKKMKLSAQEKQYTTEFDVKKFLEVIPNPEEFFNDPKRQVSFSNFDDTNYAVTFLKNTFCFTAIKDITSIFKKFNFCVLRTANALEKFQNLKSKRKPYPVTSCKNIPLLQEIAYIKHKKEILEYIKLQELEKKQARELAKASGLMTTCQCCYDDELMPDDAATCESGKHTFCKSCIKRGCEVLIGDGKLEFPCLENCNSFFTLQVLQAVLTPKVFSKMAQRRQMEEVKSAGIEDLEFCPFCDFATIPAPEDKVFRCLNTDCMKESCRLCKEPSHIPLRCDEIEKDKDVKLRTYIEDKMTEALLRKCWKCGLKFIKESGCNKMTCSCGAMMCYVCNHPVQDYKHFNGQGGDNVHLCPLYSDTHKMHVDAIKRSAESAKKELGVDKENQLKIDPTVDLDQHYRRLAEQNPAVPNIQVMFQMPNQILPR